jgi:pimeloyl-ACP methyl ester carboxylesterase
MGPARRDDRDAQLVPRQQRSSCPAPTRTPERPVWLDAPFPPVTQPTLVIWGMQDKALLPVQLELDELVPDLTIVPIEDAGISCRGRSPSW